MSGGVRISVLLVAAFGCVVAPALELAGAQSPLRVVAALALFGVAPGAALVGRLARGVPRVELALIVAVSLAVATVMSELMLALHLWSPAAGTCVLAAACLPSIALQLRAARTGTRREVA